MEPVEEMYARGRIPGAPVIAILKRYAEANDTTLTRIAQDMGYDPNLLTHESRNQSLEFNMVDKTLCRTIGVWRDLPELREHYQRVALIDPECLICGAPFTPDRHHRGRQRYCGEECRYLVKSKAYCQAGHKLEGDNVLRGPRSGKGCRTCWEAEEVAA